MLAPTRRNGSRSISVGRPASVKYKLIPQQTPEVDYTEHRLAATRAHGNVGWFAEVNRKTASGSELTFIVPQTQRVPVQKVKIETVAAKSWVSWQEIELYGCR